MQVTTDPLNEKKHEVLTQLIHKYPNRALCLLTTQCQANCPFCFRKDLHCQQNQKNPINLEKIINYLKKNPQISELIFSGGEPLLEGALLEEAVLELQTIPNLKVLRIHSRLPIVQNHLIPWKNLENIARKSKLPIYFVLHVNSDQELKSKKIKNSIQRLRQLGYILLSHTVFLKNTNDNLNTLQKLFSKLVELGVKPYYIFHCDNMAHTQKLIVPLKKERQLMNELRKTVSGLAYPLHVIDSENGKIPVPSANWQTNLNAFTDFDNQTIKLNQPPL